MRAGFPGIMSAGVGSPFLPDKLQNLQLWLDAADTTAANIVESSNLVSQWTDKSGQGNNAVQGTGANQPTTNATTSNGNNVLDFDGGDFLEIGSFTALLSELVDFTVFIALKSDVNDATDRVLFASSVDTNNRIAIARTNSDTFVTGSFNGSVFDSVDVSFTDTASFHIGTMVNTPATTGRLDGTALAGSTDNPSVSATANTTIGSRTDETVFWNGSVAEVIVYSRELSSAEVATVEKYLGNKWGVAI